MRRAEFQPAIDELGRVAEGTYSGAIRWVLPNTPIRRTDVAPPVRVSKYDAELDASGEVIGCRVEFIGGEGGVMVIFAGREICEQRFKPK